ncbi:MAG: Tn3 family transposase [Mycobacteriales bacterium]
MSKPQEAAVFIDQLREEMAAELAALNAAVPKVSWLSVADRGKQGAIKLTPLDPALEPVNLRKLKTEIRRRWGTVPLIDMLKEAVLRTSCLQGVVSAAGRGSLDPDVLAERLILAIYAYGTNTGIRAVATGGRHNHSEKDIRYMRARYLNADTAQMIAIEVANATLAARQHIIWGAASTAVASDSTCCPASNASTRSGCTDPQPATPMSIRTWRRRW